MMLLGYDIMTYTYLYSFLAAYLKLHHSHKICAASFMIVLERKQKLFLSLFEFPVFYNLPLIWSKKKEKKPKQNKNGKTYKRDGSNMSKNKL